LLAEVCNVLYESYGRRCCGWRAKRDAKFWAARAREAECHEDAARRRDAGVCEDGVYSARCIEGREQDAAAALVARAEPPEQEPGAALARSCATTARIGVFVRLRAADSALALSCLSDADRAARAVSVLAARFDAGDILRLVHAFCCDATRARILREDARRGDKLVALVDALPDEDRLLLRPAAADKSCVSEDHVDRWMNDVVATAVDLARARRLTSLRVELALLRCPWHVAIFRILRRRDFCIVPSFEGEEHTQRDPLVLECAVEGRK